MELKELCTKTLELFDISSVDELSEKLMDCVLKNDKEKQKQFVDMVEDLSVDWLQKIFQYYQADRKEKMQDYTPKSLAELMGKLAGECGKCIDMCAGSGALTIQKWNLNHSQFFEILEYDENVIPYLLFNMAIRNIECDVYRTDVLQAEKYACWKVRNGIVTEVEIV